MAPGSPLLKQSWRPAACSLTRSIGKRDHRRTRAVQRIAPSSEEVSGYRSAAQPRPGGDRLGTRPRLRRPGFVTGRGESGSRPLQQGASTGGSAMRPTHIRLVAVAGVLAVAIGVTTAFVVARDDPAQPAAAPTPTTIAAIEPADTNDRTDPAPTPTTRPPVRDEQAAKATAVAFLRELGMRDPVAATYRRTGAATAEVGLHPEGRRGRAPVREGDHPRPAPPLHQRLGPHRGQGRRHHRGRPAAALRPRPLARSP